MFLERNLGPYRETHHNYLDALFTRRLGLGHITGVFEFILGAIFYIMCLPVVRKSGYFQVRRELNVVMNERIDLFFSVVILLVSYVNTSLVDHYVDTCTEFLEMVGFTRLFVFD